MVYDGDGKRVSETVGGTTTQFLVDELNPTGYTQVMDELVNGAVTRTYAYGLQRISEDQQISGTWTPSFYGYDGHGNVRYLTNAAGAITDTYTYDAFGLLTATTGTTPNAYTYSSERFDQNIGLFHLRARDYNPLTGRFETMDPYAGDIFDPATLHRYLYSRGDPVDRIDPTGFVDSAEYVAVQEGDIDTYGSLTYRGRVAGRAGDLEFHHIIPERFACLFNVSSGVMLAIAVDHDYHQSLDNDWAWAEELEGEPCEQDVEIIKQVLQDVHSDDRYLLQQIEEWLIKVGAGGF